MSNMINRQYDKSKEIRETNMFEFSPPDEYQKFITEVDREELQIPTEEGMCRVLAFKTKKIKEKLPVHIYVHGGGFVKPHAERDELCSAKYAAMTEGLVFDIDYKLSPEYKFPTAMNEVYDVTKWIFENIDVIGGDPENVTMSGYSAGGNLISAAVIKANQTGDFRVKKQILCYPPMDLVTDPDEKKGDPEYRMPGERARTLNSLYTNDDPEIKNSPFVSMRFAPDAMLVDLPDTFVITAGKDMLKQEAHDFAVKLLNNGVTVLTKCFTDSRHGFMINCMDQWEEAQQLVINIINGRQFS